MKKQLRSSFSTQGRRMAGARALWVANGMKKNQMGKPIIAIVNSFTQFVPGHVHLHEIGQLVKAEIEKLGCFAAEFNTIAIDDGIAMGHDGMLYSLPSRDIIADSVEYMVNAHKADAMVCISNCDKITPGMLMAAMRLNIPAVFVSGGPMEAGEWNGQHLDLIDAMIKSADQSVSDEEVANIEQNACPTCGCCSGMITANSMNCLNEAIGLALPGNGTIVATNENRTQLFKDAAKLIVDNAMKYCPQGTQVRVILQPRKILIEDNGGGVAPEELAKLGQRFYRPAGQNEKGSGLGLSIVARIAELHHYRFRLENIEIEGRVQGLRAIIEL